jgi:hypothetical protein
MSDGTFPQRLTKIDELTRQDHYWLEEDDECLFLGEYTARKGYAFSETNQLILNFKKSLSTKGSAQWRYKQAALDRAAAVLQVALRGAWLDIVTLIPIPPSKAKSDPLYDDRIGRLARAIRISPAVDVREMIVQSQSTTAVHDSESRPTPDELAKLYSFDPVLVSPVPRQIGLLDDLLTTGCHFKAAKKMLNEKFPSVRVTGIFLARRVPEAVDFSAFK